MGSDVQWQIDNGYAREAMGDFSSPEYRTDDEGHRAYLAYFCTFAAASQLAKAFPGSTLSLSEKLTRRAGHMVRQYEVNTFANKNHPDAEQRARYEIEYWPALKEARAMDLKN